MATNTSIHTDTNLRIKRIGSPDSAYNTEASFLHSPEGRQLKQDFHRSLVNKSFVLHYQPRIQLETNRITGFEALVRWQREDGELIPPMNFLPLAEDTGLIEPLGEWVLDQSARDLAQIAKWMPRGSLARFTMAVNCSAKQFQTESLPDQITAAANKAGISPDRLEIEINEAIFFQDLDVTGYVLRTLKGIGVQISVKDFGASYFCLAYLKRFPVDILRIRRSLSGHLPENQDAATIVQAIIKMAQKLGLRTIAEGVENADQTDFLAKNGCDEIQGFALCRPLPLDELTEFLRARARENIPHLK